MISFPSILGADGRKLVHQNLTHPTVYLDTWAIRLFAETDPALGARFRDALIRVGGTLMLSHLNLGEFTFDDPRHARSAGRYIDTLIPHLFFSQFELSKVLDGEQRRMFRQTEENPVGGVDMLVAYAQGACQRGYPSVYDWSMQIHTDRANMQARREGMADGILKAIASIRGQLQADPKYAKEVKNDLKNSRCHPRGTHALARALFHQLALDRKVELTVNDAADLGHCIVPAAYCDFVLIDWAWLTRLSRAHAALKQLGLEPPIARLFSGRKGEVVRFLDCLESWETTRNSAAPTGVFV